VNNVAQARYYSSLDLRSAYHQIDFIWKRKGFTRLLKWEVNFNNIKRLPFGVMNGVSAFQRSIGCFIKRYQLQKVYAYLGDLTVTGETIEEHDLNLKRLLDAAATFNLTFNEDKSKVRMTRSGCLVISFRTRI